MVKKAVAAIGAAALGLLLTAAPAHASAARVIWVKPGVGTISAAVAAASPGDTLRLKVGVYRDSVTIEKTLTIQGSGRGSVLVPPGHPVTNDCNSLTGAQEGICALGAVDAMGNPDLSHRVKNVHVSSLYVHGFSDTGVLGFNTAGFKVSWVRSDHNGGYGIARFVSINSTYEYNSVSYNDEAGLYMGDSPNANSVIRDNEADHNGFGIFLRDSSFQTAEGNKVWANCIGILALNTTGGGTPAADVGNYTITDNLVWANNKACPASEDGPALSGIGVALASVKDTVVKNNLIVGNRPGGDTFASGGVAVVDVSNFAPSGNKIIGNFMARNQPADIVTDGSDLTLTIKQNVCRSLANHHCTA